MYVCFCMHPNHHIKFRTYILCITMHKYNLIIPSAAHTPTCCIWVGTDKGNVVMMTVNIESPATKDQPRTVELTPSGNVLLCIV